MIHMDYTHEPRRDILCIDIKSFFASAEAVKRNIHPLDAYIAVVSRQENAGGLVLAASPLVKQEYGIKTGSRRNEMPRRSKIQSVPPRMAKYLELNRKINQLYRRFAGDDDLHIYSIDESFLDVTHSRSLHGTAQEIATKIQGAMLEEFGLIATIGIGDNPLLAKLALDNEAKKADPFWAVWRYEDVSTKLWGIPALSDMWGIGSRMEQHLHRMGITSVKALSQADLPSLRKTHGVIGEQLFFHAHGIDRSVLSGRFLPASRAFSKSQVLPRDYTNTMELEVIIREMADQVAARLRAHEVVTNVIHLNLGYSKDILERGFSHQIKVHPTSSSRIVIQTCLDLFRKYYRGQPVRTIAIACGKISPKTLLQFNLFEEPETTLLQEELELTVDRIRRRYGYPALVQASSLLAGATAIRRASLVGGHQG